MNQNKLNGLLAEVEFRSHLANLGFADRVSPGGWIARRQGAGEFGHNTVVFFPETILPGTDYSQGRSMPAPSHGLHTICSTFHQSGISAFYCVATVADDDSTESIGWRAIQLGLPTQQTFQPFPMCLNNYFHRRNRPYNFLRYTTDSRQIPREAIPGEFSKEHVRVTFQSNFMSEISDVDGIFWGQQFTYPIEIKEKTAAEDRGMGPYFGLDVGPFVKLAFYAAKRGNLHSLFVVREIDSAESRNLLKWWVIKYEKLAQFASWVARAGGTNMQGGGSSVVRIPRSEFQELNSDSLRQL